MVAKGVSSKGGGGFMGVFFFPLHSDMTKGGVKCTPAVSKQSTLVLPPTAVVVQQMSNHRGGVDYRPLGVGRRVWTTDRKTLRHRHHSAAAPPRRRSTFGFPRTAADSSAG
jgi:hypothetical protein